MRQRPPPYLTRVVRRGRRRQQRRRWASAIAVVIVLAIVVALVIISLGDKKATNSTSTSTTPAAVSSPTSLRAGTTTSTAGAPTTGAADYNAQLSGEQEIPPVSTSARGTLELTVAEDGASVEYVLTVTDITDVTVAKLHDGKAGASGPTIVTLYGGPGRSGVYSGVLAEGTFTAADLEGSLQRKKVADLVALVESGQVYLNVGTSAHIQGEIRGQIE